MGCGYSTPKSVRDEILEIEDLVKGKSREIKNQDKNQDSKYNGAVTMWG